MISSSFVFIAIFVSISLVQCADEIRIFDSGTVPEDGFIQRNKRQEPAEESDSAEDDDVNLLQTIPLLLIVRTDYREVCYGVIITDRIILTSAICARNSNSTVLIMAKSNFPIAMDDTFDSSSVHKLRYKVSHVLIHPNFNETTLTHDIALLKLVKPIDIPVHFCLWLDNNKIPPKPMIVQLNYKFRKTFFRTEVMHTVDNLNCIRYLPPFKKEVHLEDKYLCIIYSEEKSFNSFNMHGPLYTDLVYDGYIIPYAIVSSYVEWIKDSLQELGEKVPSSLSDPLACAKEHLEYRHKINGSLPLVKNESVEFMVNIQKNTEPNQKSNCAGTLIKEDVVATLAQCAEDLIVLSSRVVMFDSSSIVIRDIFLHPDYTDDSFYNNIALLKLSEKSKITPALLYYNFIRHNQKVNLYGKQRSDNIEHEDSSGLPVKAQGLSIILNHKCNPTEEQRLRLAQELQYEHVCLQSDLSLVPGSCEADPGSPIVISDDIRSSPGLYMFGRNCGFGEPAIMILFVAHEAWINSIIDAPFRESVVYIIPNLELSDKCIYPDGTAGTCVAQTSCDTYERVKNNYPLFFCKVNTVVCCPQDNIEDDLTFAINRFRRGFDELE